MEFYTERYNSFRECCPWDCQTNVYPTDGNVGPDDLQALNNQMGQQCTSCDFGVGIDGVDDEDYFALISHWGACNCNIAQGAQAGPAGSESELTLEEALAIIGFDGVDNYIA